MLHCTCKQFNMFLVYDTFSVYFPFLLLFSLVSFTFFLLFLVLIFFVCFFLSWLMFLELSYQGRGVSCILANDWAKLFCPWRGEGTYLKASANLNGYSTRVPFN